MVRYHDIKSWGNPLGDLVAGCSHPCNPMVRKINATCVVGWILYGSCAMGQVSFVSVVEFQLVPAPGSPEGLTANIM